MWNYEKRLQHPVRITQTNPKIAQVIISQFGGPDGELAASMRYLSQRYTMPYKEVTGILTDIGTKASGMFHLVKFEDKHNTVGFKVHSFSTFDEIKKYDKSDNDESSEKAYSIELGRTERTMNLYAIASTKFEIAY